MKRLAGECFFVAFVLAGNSLLGIQMSWFIAATWAIFGVVIGAAALVVEGASTR